MACPKRINVINLYIFSGGVCVIHIGDGVTHEHTNTDLPIENTAYELSSLEALFGLVPSLKNDMRFYELLVCEGVL